MKTIPLRTLLRDPRKVKRLTRAGQPVTVTDNGRALWVLQPADGLDAGDEERRKREIDELFEEVRRGPRSQIPLSKIVLESRR